MIRHTPPVVDITDNALPPIFIEEVFSWVDSKELPLTGTNFDTWGPDVVRVSAVILARKFNPVQTSYVLGYLKTGLIPPDIPLDKVEIYFHQFTRMAYIPWHHDDACHYALSIYLNRKWDKDWGGFLIHENKDGTFQAHLPEFNKAIGFRPPLQHTVTMPSLDAPLRESLQIFIRK